ncbi:hypothetical protein [Thermoleptolyngbya sp.]
MRLRSPLSPLWTAFPQTLRCWASTRQGPVFRPAEQYSLQQFLQGDRPLSPNTDPAGRSPL